MMKKMVGCLLWRKQSSPQGFCAVGAWFFTNGFILNWNNSGGGWSSRNICSTCISGLRLYLGVPEGTMATLGSKARTFSPLTPEKKKEISLFVFLVDLIYHDSQVHRSSRCPLLSCHSLRTEQWQVGGSSGMSCKKWNSASGFICFKFYKQEWQTFKPLCAASESQFNHFLFKMALPEGHFADIFSTTTKKTSLTALTVSSFVLRTLMFFCGMPSHW